MARIKQESVEAVKAAADMLDVVGGRTQLRKAGARYVGRCPFHEERTPSFSVNPLDKLFYCFGCGKGGDLISFVRETENLDFAGAIEWLGDRFRVPLEYEETSPAADAARKRRERLYAVLEQATSFYERYLWETAQGEPVRAYLAGRGLSEEICREFRLGLSPTAPALARKAAEKGFTRPELAAAGLANRRGNDYFSGRLMFPLADARGRVVGYSARKLREDDPLQAKYVNSPEGDLFHKSSVLYGLHLARQAIAKEERAIVVEGNTDAIALRQAGLEPTVASMGTALTERQLAELKRLTRRLYLCFDADAAGQAATLRGMELAASLGFEVKVVPLAPGSTRPMRQRASASCSAVRRATSSTACASSSTALRIARRRSCASGRCSRTSRTRRSGRTPCGSSPTGSTCRRKRRPGWPRGVGRLRRARCPRRCSRRGEARA